MLKYGGTLVYRVSYRVSLAGESTLPQLVSIRESCADTVCARGRDHVR